MAFNYNPSDYLMDYSWVGEMGQHLSQVASKFPSLMKLNKEIKENREYSKIAKAQTAEMISSMDNETAQSLASEMGLGNLPANEAKLSLIKTIPDHGDMDDIKSAQEYTKKLSDEFYIPMFQAGQTYNARTNTDKLTPGSIVASLKAGKIRGEVAKSPEMQQEMELYNRGRTNKVDETFEINKEKRAEGYKIGAENRAVEQEKQQFAEDQKREIESSKAVSTIYNSSIGNIKSIFSEKTRNKVTEVLGRPPTTEELEKAFSKMLAEGQLEIQKLNVQDRTKEDYVQPTEIASMANAAWKRVDTINDDIMKLSADKKNKNTAKIEELKRAKVVAEADAKALNKLATQGAISEKSFGIEKKGALEEELEIKVEEIEKFKDTNFGKKLFDFMRFKGLESGTKNKKKFQEIVGFAPILKEDGKTLDVDATARSIGITERQKQTPTVSNTMSVSIPSVDRPKVEAVASKHLRWNTMTAQEKESLINTIYQTHLKNKNGSSKK